MITREDADRLRDQLLAVLAEDAHNTERLMARLDSITSESGIGAHAALLLILTRLAFEEGTARQHWEAVLAHRDEIRQQLGRDPGLRVSLLDYFMNVNKRLVQPTLIDLEMYEAGQRESNNDPMTGLASDRRFRSALQVELRRARRYEQRAAVVLIDVDDFAAANQRFGTLVCDRLLRELAIVLNNNIRDIDIAARPGEDELALLLPEADRNGALLVAERFRQQVQDYFATRESGGAAVGLTVSAGIAVYPDDAASAESLLERAAQALYLAKAAGRNTVQLYQPERRRYLRFELDPARFEIEVLAPRDRGAGSLRNLSRSGILFTTPEPLEVGEEIEIRLVQPGPGADETPLRLRGRVVRLEDLSGGPSADEPSSRDRYDVGVALDFDWTEGGDELLDFLERIQSRESGTGA